MDLLTTLDVTIDATRGKALQAIPRTLSTIVPAESTAVTLVAERHYVTELLAMSKPRLRAQGEISFRPVERKTYRVRGIVEPTCCSVWIEDETGVEVPGTRVSSPMLPSKAPP